MPIELAVLTQASRSANASITKSLSEARAGGKRTAFLCHSHLDTGYASGLVNILDQIGWNVYVDWQDPHLPVSPTLETARTIQERIRSAAFFLFLATPNSLSSRWCPWEIGYADGTRAHDTILIVPTVGSDGSTLGNEYLSLYRRVDLTSDRRLGVWRPGLNTNGEWLSSL